MSRLRDWLREERHQQSRLVAATALLAFVVGYAAATAVILLGRGGEGIGAAAESMRLRADNRRLARELSQLRTDTQVDREAYAGVGRQMEALQEQVLDLQEEVAFYRGIVGGGSGPGLQVKDFALAAGPDGRYALSFVVAQVAGASRETTGQVQVRLEGERNGRPAGIDAATLVTPGERAALAFRLRYFQEFRLSLAPPAGFTPARVVVRVQPAARGSRVSVVSFPWVVP